MKKVLTALLGIMILAAAVFIFFAGRRFTLVQTGTLIPFLFPGDVVSIDKTAYLREKPRRFDLVAADLGHAGKPVFFRFLSAERRVYDLGIVEALVGDRVASHGGRITVNGLPALGFAEPFSIPDVSFEVPAGSVFMFVLSPGPEVHDLPLAPTPLSRIVGKVGRIVWPLQRRGEVTGKAKRG